MNEGWTTGQPAVCVFRGPMGFRKCDCAERGKVFKRDHLKLKDRVHSPRALLLLYEIIMLKIKDCLMKNL